MYGEGVSKARLVSSDGFSGTVTRREKKKVSLQAGMFSFIPCCFSDWREHTDLEAPAASSHGMTKVFDTKSNFCARAGGKKRSQKGELVTRCTFTVE